jgi:hypothetical protein
MTKPKKSTIKVQGTAIPVLSQADEDYISRTDIAFESASWISSEFRLYLFDFLTLEEPFHEPELKTGLLAHIQKFLLELGRGFAFVGRQYRLEVSDREFPLDLLFYHLDLRCFAAVDLKKGGFKPEYAGKKNFYRSVVDDQLRHAGDASTIGLILCQTKDRILAEYSLRDIHKPIGVADYELTRALPKELASSLPSIESIEAELSQDLGPEGTP